MAKGDYVSKEWKDEEQLRTMCWEQGMIDREAALVCFVATGTYADWRRRRGLLAQSKRKERVVNA